MLPESPLGYHPCSVGVLRSAADILAPDGSSRARGRVFCLLGDLENQGRMARILVSVPNPLDVRPTPVLLDKYVRLAMYLMRKTG